METKQSLVLYSTEGVILFRIDSRSNDWDGPSKTDPGKTTYILHVQSLRAHWNILYAPILVQSRSAHWNITYQTWCNLDVPIRTSIHQAYREQHHQFLFNSICSGDSTTITTNPLGSGISDIRRGFGRTYRYINTTRLCSKDSIDGQAIRTIAYG